MIGEKRWMMLPAGSPIPIEIIYEVPKEMAEGISGAYQVKVVHVVVPPCPTCGEKPCRCSTETSDR